MRVGTLRSLATLVVVAAILLAFGYSFAAVGVLHLPKGVSAPPEALQELARKLGLDRIEVVEIDEPITITAPVQPPGYKNCWVPPKGGIGSKQFLKAIEAGKKYFGYSVQSGGTIFSARVAILGDTVLFATTWHDARLWFFSKMPLQDFLQQYNATRGNTLFDRLWEMQTKSKNVGVSNFDEREIGKQMNWNGNCP